MKTTIRAVKTIEGLTCDVYAICHHDRLQIGKAVPAVEVYEESRQVSSLAGGIRWKSEYFSVIICPDPEMDAQMTDEVLQGLTTFDLAMELPRKDGVYAPFVIYGIADADLSPGRWEFRIRDGATVRRLLAL